MSQGLFTVNFDKVKKMCTVDYSNKYEALSVEFEYGKMKTGFIIITAIYLDRIFKSSARVKKKYNISFFRELVLKSTNQHNFVEALTVYHMLTNKDLTDKYCSTWFQKMYPNGIEEIIRRAILYDLGTKKFCIYAFKN